MLHLSWTTALYAYLKPRNIFESVARRHFQKYFWVLSKRKALYANLRNLLGFGSMWCG